MGYPMSYNVKKYTNAIQEKSLDWDVGGPGPAVPLGYCSARNIQESLKFIEKFEQWMADLGMPVEKPQYRLAHPLSRSRQKKR